MRIPARCLLLLAFAISAALTAAASVQAQTISGPVLNPSQLDGRLVYASLDRTTGSWSLQQRRADGVTAPLPVAGFAQAPDADWGTLRDGTQVLVYSRDDSRGRSRLFLYDPAAQQEAVIAGSHDDGREELQPTLWNGTLGFWRRDRDAVDDGEYRLFTLGSDRPSRTVKRLRAGQSVLGADLNGRGLALTALWRRVGFREVSVQVKHYNQGFRTVLTAASGELSSVFLGEPSWRGNHVYWAFARRADAPRRQIGRAYITQRATEISTATPPRPSDARADILGVAADNSDPASPFWVNTFTAGEENEDQQSDASLYPLAVGAVRFPEPAVGL